MSLPIMFLLAAAGVSQPVAKQPLKVLTPAQFKTLPPETPLELGAMRTTKGELLGWVERDVAAQQKSKQALPPSPATDPRMKAFDQEQAQKLQQANQKVRAAASKKLNVSKTHAVGLMKPEPKITEVLLGEVDGQRAITPGGFIAVKGENLQAWLPGGKGVVTLVNTATNGTLCMVARHSVPGQTDGTVILLEVPEGLTGIEDCMAELVFTAPNAKSTRSGGHPFRATRGVVRMYRPELVSFSGLSENASLSNSAEFRSSGYIRVYHFNVPTYPETTGQDIFEFALKPGWKIDHAYSDGYRLMSVLPLQNRIRCDWVSPRQETYSGLILGDNFYQLEVLLSGPVGTSPY